MKTLYTISMIFLALVAHAQWTTQGLGFTTNQNIGQIRITSPNNVWVLSTYTSAGSAGPNSQLFTKTNDGGATWTPGLIDIGHPTWVLIALAAIDNNTAWVAAIDDSGATGGGVWKTTNGGSSWVRYNATGYQDGANFSFIDGMHFFDANNGISYGDPVGGQFEIYKTSDAGLTWSQITGTANPSSLLNEYAVGSQQNSCSAGGSFWFTTSKGNIYRTTDQGTTWSKFAGPTGLTSFFSANKQAKMIFKDVNNGLIYGSLDNSVTFKIWRTSDGGATWDAGSPYTEPYKEMCYIPGTNILVGTAIVGMAYSTGKSLDNGVTWSQIGTGTYAKLPTFFNASTGWASNSFNSSTTNGIYKFNLTLGSSKFDIMSNFAVSPNPTNSTLNIQSNTAINSVKIIDISGRSTTPTFENNKIDVSNLANGIYLIEATTENGVVREKFIKN